MVASGALLWWSVGCSAGWSIGCSSIRLIFYFYEQTLFFILDPLVFINGGLLAHWTALWAGWWKNMLVCWVVENMLIGG